MARAAYLRGVIADQVIEYGRACAKYSHAQPCSRASEMADADCRRLYADINRMLAELADMAGES